MPRNIQGKPVKPDTGKEKINTQEPSNKGTKSREAEPKEAKPKSHLNDKTATVHEAAGDTNNDIAARKNPQATPPGEDMMALHHDRLKRIEDHLGLKPPTDNMKGEDQAKMGKGKEVGHVTEKKGTPNYGRKRH